MILKIFLFWRIGLFFITALGANIFALSQNGGLGAPTNQKDFDYWLSWAQWDGGYYFSIAKQGYTTYQDYAFFPLYPILIQKISALTQLPILPIGLVVSNLAFLGFLKFFYKFLRKNYTKETSINSLITFLCFPTTFFAVALYSEGLFLLFCAAFFAFVSQKKYLEAAVATLFASLTRLAGSFLIISYIYHFFASKQKPKPLFVILSSTAIASYAILLYSKLNNPLFFVSTQTIWERTTNDPLSTIVGHTITLIKNPARPFDQYLDLLITVMFLGLLTFGISKLKSSLWIFSMLVILVPASTGTLTSMPRYALASLGAFVVIGLLLEKYPKFKFLVWGISLSLQAILAVRFVNGYWVA